ncbi:Uu.00g063130.m01.CDS01 [Anthostomella pinea]|uniref:Uu.00g063130.m01.CDS01 n=1 Tax=Anthostomella pinea TaxID=933095 RepID=A0AAI8VTC4_9PEZI|nr:Uu.00g063130.m01.CDS01 [Anthostomella pinea]
MTTSNEPPSSAKLDNDNVPITTGQDDRERAEKEQGEPPGSPPKQSLERWNVPSANKYRYFATILCFIIMGMNDAAVGALLPYVGPYYGVSYTIISLIFLAPWGGYLVAAMCNNLIHHHLGQRGVAVLGPLTRILGYVALCVHPPFAALPPLMLLPGFGNGIEDSAWNAWIGNMESANELLGFIHGAYGLGATIGPLIATAMVTKMHLEWFTFYYIMLGLSVLELGLTTTTFWGATGAVYRATMSSSEGGRTTTRSVMAKPIPWLVALFLLGYVGAEVSLGGWIVTFMLDVRHALPFESGLTAVFFWLGLTIGRVTLGFATGRIGEKLAITVYLLLSVALQLLYWLIPNFIASAVFVAFEGFLLGPRVFPAAIVAATKLLPSDAHVSAIGFAAAFGGGGAAVFPFAIGAIAQVRGVWVVQPIVLAILVFILVVWSCLPGGLRRGGLEHARDTDERIGQQVLAGFRKLRHKRGET